MSKCRRCKEAFQCAHDGVVIGSKDCKELRKEMATRIMNRKVCKKIGHDIVSDDWANSETGGISGSCKRCDFEFKQIFY